MKMVISEHAAPRKLTNLTANTTAQEVKEALPQLCHQVEFRRNIQEFPPPTTGGREDRAINPMILE